jgi:phosphate transport system substrate-binding protein
MVFALPLAALLVACGSNSSTGGGSTSDIHVVGSSTVYPFTKAVAEDFMRANPGINVPVESTGTGAGMKLFCAGVGGKYPDIEDASRAIKKSEYDTCVQNGVKTIIEVPVGIDGLTIIEANSSQPMNLTQADIYKALAANPFGKGPNTAQTWKDVNPSLPALKIRVLGPPPTSGTRDSLADLYLTKGCDTDPTMKALAKSNEDQHKDYCTKIREDGAYVEAGENDNLLVQKVSSDPGTLGVLGYSYLEQNADKVRPVQIAGIAPTEDTPTSPTRARASSSSTSRASISRPNPRCAISSLNMRRCGARAARLSARAWCRSAAPTRLRRRRNRPRSRRSIQAR